ncbi:MAG: hypothetical protein CSA05_00500 [Bacteroidia bacterium]|nr:MAG: hypothetical protein CSB01_00210 [Bacteroidia bacterium]PIE86428.1 MAG: hypothetical protein CSA05_00500 [Bacteroidia bacterium]
MKTMHYPLVFIFLVLLSCTTNISSQISGTGDWVEEVRQVSDFSSLSLNISGNVYIQQGSPQKVVVKGQQNILDVLKTNVKGNTLEIKFKKKVRTHKKVDIFVTIPHINGLLISGSGNIKSNKAITTNKIELGLSGSGNIELAALNTKKIEVFIAGSGNIELAELNTNEIDMLVSGSGNIEVGKGKEAKKLEITLSGSGEIDTKELACEKVNIVTSGSGNCNVYATKYLEAVVSGSGEIYYKGNPQINTTVSGSGKIRSL